MKFLMVVTLFSSFTMAGFAQSPDCKKFKNGNFYYPGFSDKISIRTDSIQKSYYFGKLEMIWKVKWLSECEYELICQQIFVKTYSTKPGDRIVATIIKTDNDCFTTSLVYYNNQNPEGKKGPTTEMCIAD